MKFLFALLLLSLISFAFITETSPSSRKPGCLVIDSLSLLLDGKSLLREKPLLVVTGWKGTQDVLVSTYELSDSVMQTFMGMDSVRIDTNRQMRLLVWDTTYMDKILGQPDAYGKTKTVIPFRDTSVTVDTMRWNNYGISAWHMPQSAKTAESVTFAFDVSGKTPLCLKVDGFDVNATTTAEQLNDHFGSKGFMTKSGMNVTYQCESANGIFRLFFQFDKRRIRSLYISVTF